MERLEIEDFSGGVTDYYLNAPQNKAAKMDNLLLNKYPQLAKPFVRPGTSLFHSNAPQIPAGNQRINTCFFINQDIFNVQSAKKVYYFRTSDNTWQTIALPSGVTDHFSLSDTNAFFTHSEWNYHRFLTHSKYNRPRKIYLNTSNTPVCVEAGLPKVDSSSISIVPAAGANVWLYRFVYRYDYTVKGSVMFSDYGEPSNINAPAAGDVTVAITSIPVLANTADDAMDTVNIKVEIYRTTNAGTVFYKVGEVTNGTTTFNDTVTDANLTAGQKLYTTGGVVANGRPPQCKLTHVFNDTGYYANVKEGSSEYNFRLYQSVPGDIDAVPATFFIDIDDEIVGMGSTKSNLLLLGKRSIYRIDGVFDLLGRGGMVATRISDTASCVSAQSVVQTLYGVFWAGFEGMYFSDGFRVVKLNGDYDTTWSRYVNSANEATVTSDLKRQRIQGKYDQRKNRIWWSVQHETDSGSDLDVDKSYILDLEWGIHENATFTTASGLTSYSPTAFEFDDGDLIRCDRRGYVLKHSNTRYSDLKVDTAVAATSWVDQTIYYDLTSVAYNFGTSFTRKYVTNINMTIDASTNVSCQIVSNNDDKKSINNLSPIRFRGNILWGDDVYWGDPSIIWGQDGLITEKRRMPKMALRCNYKQIQFKNAFVAIISSENIGTCDINSTLKTALLTNAATTDWPLASVDYYIAFESDNYVTNYLITSRSGDGSTLTYADPGNTTATIVGSKWVLRGFPKNEQFNLINYSLGYHYFGQTQDVFKNSESGEITA